MRIHGVHLHGLRIPSGEYRIEFEPGYNVLVAGGASDVLAHALAAPLLCPEDLEALGPWVDPDPAISARVGLGLSFGADAYRVVADLRRWQVAVARYDATLGVQTRIARGAREVAAKLRELGVPDLESFRVLHACGGFAEPFDVGAAGSGEDTEPVLEPSISRGGAAARIDPGARIDPEDGTEDRERLKLLRDARQRLSRVEREIASAAQELELSRGVAAVAEDFEGRLRRYREQLELRDGEIAAVEAARRSLLDERNQLRQVPRSERGGTWIGLALGVGGAVVAQVASPALYALSGVGFGLALFFALVRRSARRRLGRVEARLSGLRVRERSVQHSFESETREITGALGRLDLNRIEDLQRAVADYRGLMSRIERLQGELQEAQRAFAHDEVRELEQLEALERRKAARDAEVPEPRREPRRARSSLSPEDLIAAAARQSGQSEVDVRSRMAPSLPLYLRTLTEGRLTQARRDPSLAWELRHDDSEDFVPLETLSRDELEAVLMAFRLALLEGLAPSMRIPLLIGPGLWPGTPARRVALGRALRRLASVVQIVHVTDRASEWDAHATSVHPLHASQRNAS